MLYETSTQETKVKYFFEKSIAVCACLALIFYWGITLLYVAPNNPIRVNFTKELGLFEDIFYQKWEFFAPPPKFNTRLYYHFIPNRPSLKDVTVEVLQPIYQAKQKQAPFNEGPTILDYTISGAVDQIQDYMVERHDMKETLRNISENSDTNLVKALVTEFNETNTIEEQEHLPAVITLKNYAYYVSSKNHLLLNDYKVEIYATTVAIPAYKDKALVLNHMAHSQYPEEAQFKIQPFDVPVLGD